MGIKSFFMRILRHPERSEALQSDLTSLQSDSKALLERSKALQEPITQELPSNYESPSSIELQKDSLELGLAAGYTGRSLKSIESSLVRIESQMTTRDWFNLQFGESLRELADVLRQHENKAQIRFESIQNSLNSLKGIADISPESIKPQLYRQIQAIESQLPPTPRMREIVETVKQNREMSYEDLAKKLNLGESGLRGLLSVMMKRTEAIERFEKDGKGWVRFTDSSDLKRSESEGKAGEALLRYNFESIAEKQGFSIVKRFIQTPPDFIIEKDSKSIGVELKLGSDTASLTKGIGQLLFARSSYNLQELWLVMPPQYQPITEDWIKTFKSQGIKVFILSQEGLKELY